MKRFHSTRKRFDKFSLEYCGSGLGHNRYAHGIYLGTEDTALKYKEIFQNQEDFGIDCSYELDGVMIRHDSPLAKALDAYFNGEALESVIEKNASVKGLLERAIESVSISKGITYQVKIPKSVSSNIAQWDERIEAEEAFSSFASLVEQYDFEESRYLCAEKLNAVPDFNDVVGLVSAEESVQSLVDKCAHFADTYIKKMDGEGASPGLVEITEYLRAHLVNDVDAILEMGEEVGDIIHMDVLDALEVLDIPEFPSTLSPTHGELYKSICSIIETNQNLDEQKASKETSKFISAVLGVDGYEALDIYSDGKEKELILISQKALDSISMSEFAYRKTKSLNQEGLTR
ncbi:hypothetical protein [Vibrio owensii]|uniref:hypothetical protein n=1 Tax=Vibrio owensii TaxID=696485 RepID=UPI003CC6B284